MSETVTGVLGLDKRGGGYLRSPARSFQSRPEDPWVPPQLVQRHALIDGAVVEGTLEKGRKGPQLGDVSSICGLSPAAFRGRTHFDKLTAINPAERFRLGDGGNVTMRIVDLVAPLARGTRAMIVSPPKAGKTQILEDLAIAISACDPETRIVVLLIDERPEEVTHFRRRVPAEVLASSSDQDTATHVRLAELAMAQVRCELECGRDVVVLIDSLTRLGRAFNLHAAGSGRTMTGGLDARALEIPRKIFGMARNIEHGGSVTVVASALVETGSRMDDLIFEEFKGTGNSEIVLDRSLAENRVFPAIDLRASGTRRDELLYSVEDMARLNTLRRRMVQADPKTAMLGLLKLIEQTADNAALLRSVSAL